MDGTQEHADARDPLVIIVGAGFAGLAAARALRRAPVRVLLLDQTNHHLFQPLLYQGWGRAPTERGASWSSKT